MKKRILMMILAFVIFTGLYFLGGEIVKEGTAYTTQWTEGITSPDMGAENGIDINSATQDELMRVPGIGEIYSENIIKLRKEMGGFKSMDDLIGANGVGEKRLKMLKVYFKVEKEKKNGND